MNNDLTQCFFYRYEFRFTGSTWEEARKLIASDAAISDNFGGAVALAGGTVVVSAENDDPVGNNSGHEIHIRGAIRSGGSVSGEGGVVV